MKIKKILFLAIILVINQITIVESNYDRCLQNATSLCKEKCDAGISYACPDACILESIGKCVIVPNIALRFTEKLLTLTIDGKNETAYIDQLNNGFSVNIPNTTKTISWTGNMKTNGSWTNPNLRIPKTVKNYKIPLRLYYVKH